MDRRGDRPHHLTIGTRSSPLAQAQVLEIIASLITAGIEVSVTIRTITTTGDLDIQTPLWGAQDDFFTKEIDELVLNGTVRVGVHSAKDLPKKTPRGLALVALTQSIDHRDSLIMRPEDCLFSLPKHALVGTSSLRRMAMVPAIRSDLQAVSIRGTIQERLEQLKSRRVDALIMARAAMVRLRIEDISEEILPFDTEPLQGRLAVVSTVDDQEMYELFRTIDTRVSS